MQIEINKNVSFIFLHLQWGTFSCSLSWPCFRSIMLWWPKSPKVLDTRMCLMSSKLASQPMYTKEATKCLSLELERRSKLTSIDLLIDSIISLILLETFGGSSRVFIAKGLGNAPTCISRIRIVWWREVAYNFHGYALDCYNTCANIVTCITLLQWSDILLLVKISEVL